MADRFASRLGAKDHTLWGAAAEEESAKRLGWVDLSATSQPLVEAITALREELRGAGLTRVVLCGMGGSSLAPEVICGAAGVDLDVLDSSDPDFVRAALERDLSHTVVVVSSKSGGTVETDSQRRAYEKAFADAGIDARERIVVVTDPGSPLDQSATEAGYRVFRADPSVGGRFSALTAFGLVPSGLAGADIGALLAEAEAIRGDLERDSVDNPGLRLGALIGVANLAGVDKLVLCNAEAPYAGFGDWAEQLIAESTGKNGKGVLPVIVESATAPNFSPSSADEVLGSFGPGWLFDDVRTKSGWGVSVDAPLGAQMLLWEHATSVAGAIIGINPFDQPDVESAKAASRELLDGGGADPEPRFTDGAITVYASPGWLSDDVDNVHDAITELLAGLDPRPATSPCRPTSTGTATPPWPTSARPSRRRPSVPSPSAGVHGSCTPRGSTTRAGRPPASTSRSPVSPSATSPCPTGRSPSTSSSSPKPWATGRSSRRRVGRCSACTSTVPARWTPYARPCCEPLLAAAWTNPLRDPQDRRLPRIAGPCGLVLFGVTGDLSRKKVMPAIYDLANRGLLPPGFSLVGYARRDWANQDFAAIVHDSVKTYARTEFREEVWKQLAEGFRFVPGDFDDDVAFANLARTLDELDVVRGTGGNHAFYLAIPPAFFGAVVDQLKEHDMVDKSPHAWRRVVIEKPFGHDLQSAKELQATLSEAFPVGVDLPDRPLPRQGDGAEHPGDAVRQRDVRAALELQLRRPRADHHGRGHRHRRPRRLLRRHRGRPRRDPEPPPPAARAGRDGGADLLRRREPPGREAQGPQDHHPPPPARPVDGTRPVRRGMVRRRQGAGLPPGGGHQGRGRPPRRSPRSSSHIDNRRWAGVPFYLRAGKRLARRVTEVAIVFKPAPHLPFTAQATEELTHNALVIRVQPDEGTTLRFGAKVPGTAMEIRDVNMDFAYGGSFVEASPEAYERLILDVLLGDPPLFPHHEEVEESWRILDPIIDYWARKGGRPEQYPSGGWGPESADAMLARDGRLWRRP